VSQVTSALHGLKELGVKLAIDDFGSGYSSLSYLNDLPVDVLKIDRSLVTGMGNDPAKTEIVSAAISVAHALGLQAVAEGVETSGDLEELRRLGCDFGQGYYWSKPVPANAAAILLQRPAST
jgi:EAL domain-containing protein (putative c-di-GMP-specific phosphodiesterase class I)